MKDFEQNSEKEFLGQVIRFRDSTVKNRKQISDSDCEKLSRKIRDDIFKPLLNLRTTVFLCGADLKKTNSIRGGIAEALKMDRSHSRIDLVYPEDLFEELLYGTGTNNLLILENLLVENVDAVAIIPESPGSFTELGAFVNNEQLRKKVVCILDKKYKKEKSFINRGPVKLIKEISKERVIFVDPRDIERETEKIIPVLKKMKINDTAKDDLNLFQVPNFIIPAIYLLEPVPKEILARMISFAVTNSNYAEAMTTTALGRLQKEKHVERTRLGYILTKTGVSSYFDLRSQGSKIKIQNLTNTIDEIRLGILNSRLRNKILSI